MTSDGKGFPFTYNFTDNGDTFTITLVDVDPSSFSSESGKVLVVNSDENAITFTGLLLFTFYIYI